MMKWAGVWAGCGRLGVNFWFPDNNLSLRWPIDIKLEVYVAYAMRQLGIVESLLLKIENPFLLNNSM